MVKEGFWILYRSRNYKSTKIDEVIVIKIKNICLSKYAFKRMNRYDM